MVWPVKAKAIVREDGDGQQHMFTAVYVTEQHPPHPADSSGTQYYS